MAYDYLNTTTYTNQLQGQQDLLNSILQMQGSQGYHDPISSDLIEIVERMDNGYQPPSEDVPTLEEQKTADDVFDYENDNYTPPPDEQAILNELTMPQDDYDASMLNANTVHSNLPRPSAPVRSGSRPRIWYPEQQEEKYGGKPKYQVGGQPTRQDSLNLYNNANAVLNYYKSRNYKEYTEKDFDENQKAEYNATKYMGYEGALSQARKMFDRVNQEGKIKYPATNGRAVQGKIDRSLYYKPIDDDHFYQRDLQSRVLDTRSPAPFYDSRIEPTKLNIFKNDNTGDPLFGDWVHIYGYDPSLVKPYDMLTTSEKIQRDKIMGRKQQPPQPSPTKSQSYKDSLNKYNTAKVQYEKETGLKYDDLLKNSSGISYTKSGVPVGYRKPTPPINEESYRQSNIPPTQVRGVDMTTLGSIRPSGSPLNLTPRPTNYSLTYRDENSPSKQNSIYFNDLPAWRAAVNSKYYTPTSTEENPTRATAAGYLNRQYGGTGYNIGDDVRKFKGFPDLENMAYPTNNIQRIPFNYQNQPEFPIYSTSSKKGTYLGVGADIPNTNAYVDLGAIRYSGEEGHPVTLPSAAASYSTRYGDFGFKWNPENKLRLTFSKRFQTGGALYANDYRTQRIGLNNPNYSTAMFPMKGTNVFRGLDSYQPVAVTDGSKYKILYGPHDMAKFNGNVYEHKL